MPLGNLTDCEKELVRCTRDGDIFTFEIWATDQGIDGHRREEARKVDGAVISALLRGNLPAPNEHLDSGRVGAPPPRGVIASGIKLLGGLDLHDMQLIASLSLVRCEIGGISATGARINGSLLLAACSIPEGIDLMGARVSGSLLMDGAIVGREGRDFGLRAHAMHVEGSVHMRTLDADIDPRFNPRFQAHGRAPFDLSGATIGGNLDMRGAKLGDLESEVGMQAERLEVKGHLHLSSCVIAGKTHHFESYGEDAVCLDNAKIGGNVTMAGAILGNDDTASCLYADGLSVNGSVFLTSFAVGDEVHPFTAVGTNTLSFSGARISGSFNLIEATLTTPKEGWWLHLGNASVGNNLWLESIVYKGGGSINLMDANVSVLVDSEDGWPAAANSLSLDGLSYKRLNNTNLEHRLDWLAKQSAYHLAKLKTDEGNRSLRPQPFEQCAKVLYEMGHPRDARRILIYKETLIGEKWKSTDFDDPWWRLWSPEDYRTDNWGWRYVVPGRRPRWSFRKLDPLLRWLWYQAKRYTTNYGFSSTRPLIWFVGLVLLGWFIYADAGGEPGDIMVPAQTVVLVSEPYLTSKRLPDDYPHFSASFYSLDVALPLIEMFQEPYWEPAGNKSHEQPGWFSGPFVRVFQIVQVLFGWVFISLFVAGLANAIRRDD